MIGIIDYGVGNLASLGYALTDIKAEFIKTGDIDKLKSCDALILPGVGHAGYAMTKLIDYDLVDFLKSTEQKLIGICLGMQLLYETTEETNIPLLGRIPGKLAQFRDEGLPHVHMGWNSINESYDAYFVHSFFAPINTYTIGRTEYGVEFTSIVKKDQMVGFQFHPEKSSSSGLKLLQEALKGAR